MTTRTLLVFAAAAGLSAATIGPASADTQLGPDVLHYDGLAAPGITGPQTVARAGDVNGDGFDDMVVGAPDLSPNGHLLAGSAFIVFGSARPSSGSVAAGLRIDGGTNNGGVGQTVAAAGDVNHDGYDDVAIGSNDQDYMGRAKAGKVVVVKGGPALTAMDLATAPSGRWWVIGGAAAGDCLGAAMAGADVTNDGVDDLVLASPNTAADAHVTVVPGGPLFGSLDLAAPGAAIQFTGPAGTGQSLAMGDVNGDGATDLLIGSVIGSMPPQPQAYVVFGHVGLASAALAATSPGVAVVYPGPMGINVGPISAADMDGNGTDDLVLATWAPGDISVRVLPGHPITAGTLNLGDPALNVVRFLSSGSDMFGWSLASPGDVDADGFADLVVGAPTARSAAGAAYVLRGSASLHGAVLPDARAGSVIDGPALDAGVPPNSAYSLATIGDFSGGGGQDVAIAAPGADTAGVDSGAVYVVFGAPPAATLTVTARAASKPIPRTGSVKLVKGIVVGPGESASIKVTRTPKRLVKRSSVTKTAATVRIRTRHAPKGKVKVTVTASGAAVAPVTWTRAWRVK